MTTDIVFIHQNMPGQFRYLAQALARLPDTRVWFVTRREGVTLPGVTSVVYRLPDEPGKSAEPLARAFEGSARFARGAAGAALDLRRKGVRPALVFVHPGWGEGLLIRDVWPQARIVSYAEYYYQPVGGDIGFDPLFPATAPGFFNARMMNANLLLAHEAADVLLAPTHWQASRHPDLLQGRIEVIFDGVDTARVTPDPAARFALPGGRELTRADEVITYVARNLEPHRGYHQFIRSLPMLLAARPRAEVVIVGGEEVSYSPLPRDGSASWKAKLAAEVDLGVGAARVHHLGKLAYADYLSLLRVSAAHVYLTYPFVLSWSFMEAMAAGCLMVASDTAPVREVARHGENALLFPFFDGAAMVATISAAIDDRRRGEALRAAARATVVERYDLQLCLRRQLELVQRLLAQGPRRLPGDAAGGG
ncbi:MAG: glycosyltransferase [Proteobacteria bacterium]|nr:glycosyltransferase [Pseudomonadota bacterium]